MTQMNLSTKQNLYSVKNRLTGGKTCGFQVGERKEKERLRI